VHRRGNPDISDVTGERHHADGPHQARHDPDRDLRDERLC
jgi:hypothetical protein